MTNTTDYDAALALMKRADPVDLDLLVASDALDAAWAELDLRRAYTDAPVSTRTRFPFSDLAFRAGSRRRFGAALAVGIAAAAAAIAALPDGSPTNPLSAAAAVAAEQPTTVAPPGKYYYLHDQMFGYDNNTAAGKQTTDEQWWLASDGSGRVVVTNAGAGNPIKGTSDERFGPGQFGSLYGNVPGAPEASAPDPSSIPSDPTALRQYLESQWQQWVNADPAHRGAPADTPEGDYLLPNIAALLEDPQLSPQVRSALFTVAGELPGISVEHDATDAAGQHGEVVSVPLVSTEKLDPAQEQQAPRIGASPTSSSSTSSQVQLFFDPSTSQILAWQILIPGFSPRGVTFSNAGIVTTDTATPVPTTN